MDEPKQDVGPNHPDPEHSDGIVRRLLNPVVFIALINTFGVFALIGAAMLGMDNGVLRGMADSGFARGLITYLFAVVTIGTAVVLVVYALTTADHERFNRGKEVLSLLLGVFGTIVGFYFGSETQSAHTAAQLSLAQPMLSRQQIESGGQLGITTVISGGDKPYHIGFALGEQDLKFRCQDYYRARFRSGFFVVDIYLGLD